MNTITILSVGNTAEDLRSLCDRIREGDTPGAKELLAILENCICLLQEQSPKTAER